MAELYLLPPDLPPPKLPPLLREGAGLLILGDSIRGDD